MSLNLPAAWFPPPPFRIRTTYILALTPPLILAMQIRPALIRAAADFVREAQSCVDRFPHRRDERGERHRPMPLRAQRDIEVQVQRLDRGGRGRHASRAVSLPQVEEEAAYQNRSQPSADEHMLDAIQGQEGRT